MKELDYSDWPEVDDEAVFEDEVDFDYPKEQEVFDRLVFKLKDAIDLIKQDYEEITDNEIIDAFLALYEQPEYLNYIKSIILK